MGRVEFLLLKLLLFENKKIENIRPRKNADCTECSIVLCLRENGAEMRDIILEILVMHLPRGSNKMKNPQIQKKAGTLEHFRTINKILTTFLDKVQCNQWVTSDL